MKKIVSILLAIALLTSLCVLPLQANNIITPRWTNTSKTVVSLNCTNGMAYCNVSISGYSNTTITNVDISFDKVIGNNLINIASWNDLSSGKYFSFSDSVPIVELDCFYRLTFTADVVLDGVVETVTNYKECFYTSN